MSGYVKKIAVIKQLKGGFSADGGQISGLVKAETYAGFLKVEVSLINLAPLTEGKYILGITDGLKTVVFEGGCFEGESDFNLNSGFAFLVCFCHTSVAPVASAACGQMACALPDLKEEMAKSNLPQNKKYDDEAITEINYYEQNGADEDGDAVRENKEKEKERTAHTENEENLRSFGGEKNGKDKTKSKNRKNGGKVDCGKDNGGKGGDGREDVVGGFAGGDFYSRMRDEIENIIVSYPREKSLEACVEGSRFVKIPYGDGKFYVFGVMCVDGSPRYICYGVPANGKTAPPLSLKNLASLIPTPDGGYFMTYQDASTGVSVKLVDL